MNFYMQNLKKLWAISLLFVCFFNGCQGVMVFPENTDALVIRTPQAFYALKNDPARLEDDRIKIAGRIILAKIHDNAVKMTAEWLPFPDDSFVGPEARSTGEFDRRITVYFDGLIDEDGMRYGNEFLIMGSLAIGQELEQLKKVSQSALAFSASCMHIWKTGAADLSEFIWMDPLDESYWTPLEQTYCDSEYLKENGFVEQKYGTRSQANLFALGV